MATRGRIKQKGLLGHSTDQKQQWEEGKPKRRKKGEERTTRGGVSTLKKFPSKVGKVKGEVGRENDFANPAQKSVKK